MKHTHTHTYRGQSHLVSVSVSVQLNLVTFYLNLRVAANSEQRRPHKIYIVDICADNTRFHSIERTNISFDYGRPHIYNEICLSIFHFTHVNEVYVFIFLLFFSLFSFIFVECCVKCEAKVLEIKLFFNYSWKHFVEFQFLHYLMRFFHNYFIFIFVIFR